MLAKRGNSSHREQTKWSFGRRQQPGNGSASAFFRWFSSHSTRGFTYDSWQLCYPSPEPSPSERHFDFWIHTLLKGDVLQIRIYQYYNIDRCVYIYCRYLQCFPALRTQEVPFKYCLGRCPVIINEVVADVFAAPMKRA